eukprot:1015158-Pyramimonas_sp.AAC.1
MRRACAADVALSALGAAPGYEQDHVFQEGRRDAGTNNRRCPGKHRMSCAARCEPGNGLPTMGCVGRGQWGRTPRANEGERREQWV